MQTHMQINFDNEYLPDVVSAPGETLQEILEERYMTQTELADRLGLAQKTVNEIIRGKAPLTHETALSLETVLGIPASFWNAYETAYRESLARKEGAEKLVESTSWLDTIPWKKAADMGWLSQQASPLERIMELLRFFGVASPKQYEEVYGNLAVQWKRSPKFAANPHATAFWLRRGEMEATKVAQTSGIVLNEYDSRKFEQCLVQIRALTRDREPASFVPELQRLCASAGVIVVFIPELEGTRAGGVTRWLSPICALIQLSLRHKTSDHLWFYFFHEAAHVLKHSKKRLFLEYDGKDKEDLLEQEADEFAQNMLIPPREYSALLRMGKPTKAGIEAFAEQIGVDPGIVVGRLQHERVILRNQFNDLKQPYAWEFIVRR